MTRFAESRRLVPELVVLDHAGSTNDVLAERATGSADWTTVVTDRQTAGHGRRGRSWSMPAGRGLAVSVLLPAVSEDAVAWLPLAAGLAMRDATAEIVPRAHASVKWPNDVLVGERKLCGVLGRFSGDRVVMGAGVNTLLRAGEAPVPTATSLVMEGADPDGLEERVLAGYLRRLRALVDDYLAAGSDAERSGLRDAVRGACSTLGQRVRVDLPGGVQLVGVAEDIAPDARLVVRTDLGATELVAAGDVTHVRRMEP